MLVLLEVVVSLAHRVRLDTIQALGGNQESLEPQDFAAMCNSPSS